jgi:hypothetical protein
MSSSNGQRHLEFDRFREQIKDWRVMKGKSVKEIVLELEALGFTTQ